MKKFLLIAAMAALALGANADGYKFEQVWKNTDVTSLYLTGSRQGFGMNGKFYINDTQWNGEGESTIYIYGENGLETTMPGSANTAITRDEAGNLVVMDNTAFSAHTNDDPWPLGAAIKVINLASGESKVYEIPPDALLSGRCDFLGFPKGNLMEEGEIYITSGNARTDFIVLSIVDGELDTDNCYRVNNDLTLSTTSTVINYYVDANGNEALLYVTRNAPLVKIPMDDLTGGTKFTLPFRGPSNGAFPFVFDGKEFILYPYKATTDVNYLDGFIITELGAEEPTAIAPATITAPINGYQNNWVNAEVDANGVNIYHYYPGGYIEVWRLTKDEPVPEPQNVYMIGGDDQGWDPTSGTLFDYDAENNVYTATITFPAEFNYFGFTTELAENNDDGGWGYIEPFRFGAIADEGTDYWYTGEEEFISLTWDDYHAIRIPGGKYKLTVNLDEMKLIIERTSLRGDVNRDGVINIGDVTALINHVLSKDYTENEDFSPANADVNNDETWNVADVTMLINYVLSKNWPE